MNSSQYKDSFHKAYETFYQEHEIVFSLPFGLNWIGNANPMYNGISIKQKLPMRIYFGARKYNHHGGSQIRLLKIHYIDSVENQVISKSIYEYLPYGHDLENLIISLCQELTSNTKETFEISIFSELPKGVGLGFDQLIITGILSLIYRIYDQFTIAEITKRKEIPINELINNGVFTCSKIYSQSVKWLEKLFQFGQSNDYITNSLFYGPYPTVCFPGDRINKNKVCRMYAYKLNNLVPGLGLHPHIPIDFGIFYSGRPLITEQLTSQLQLDEDYKSKMLNAYKSRFSKDIDIEIPIDKPFFYKFFVEQEIKNGSLLDYMTALSGASMEMLYRISIIYRKGHNEIDTQCFIEMINKLRSCVNISKKPSIHLQYAMNVVYSAFNSKAYILGYNYLDTNTSGGCIYFSLPYDGYRNLIQKAEKTMEEGDSGARLIYANWKDGLEYQGLTMEQDISFGIYSEFTKKTAFQITSTHHTLLIGNHEDLIYNSKDDIIFDTLRMKVLMQGKSVSSKELHSQSATIEIISFLLQNIGVTLSNSDLPHSSYIKSKNEIQGKIIGPLQQVCMKYFGKNLSIDITGSGSHYFITLHNSNISIGVLSDNKAEKRLGKIHT